MVFLYRTAPVETVHYLEYIQSSGTQYIKTGFQPDQNTRVVMDVQSLDTETAPFFGSRNGGSTGSFVMWCIGAAEVRTDYANDQTAMSVLSVTARVTIDKNKNVTTFGSVTKNQTYTTFTGNYEIALLAVMESDGVDPRLLPAKLYSCQIYDNGTLVRDYWPAKDQEGVVCLYDRVNKEYAYNAGTGTFTAGPDL